VTSVRYGSRGIVFYALLGVKVDKDTKGDHREAIAALALLALTSLSARCDRGEPIAHFGCAGDRSRAGGGDDTTLHPVEFAGHPEEDAHHEARRHRGVDEQSHPATRYYRVEA
jgi:hypothetical protein